MDFYVLVDYDNFPPLMKTRNLVYIFDRVLNTFDYTELVPYSHIHIRLYGGWYKQSSNTKLAQDLAREIALDFPRPKIITNANNGMRLRLSLNASLACSLLVTPSHHLLDTFRENAAPKGIMARHPNTLGCSNSSCPLIVVHDFINNGGFTTPCCKIKLKDMLYRGEQKLVDSMLISDLVYICTKINQYVCIVSSDDDFWPGIETAIALNATVYHIHTFNRSTPHYYVRGVTSKYKERII